jgi:hypothetical protein
VIAVIFYLAVSMIYLIEPFREMGTHAPRCPARETLILVGDRASPGDERLSVTSTPGASASPVTQPKAKAGCGGGKAGKVRQPEHRHHISAASATHRLCVSPSVPVSRAHVITRPR